MNFEDARFVTPKKLKRLISKYLISNESIKKAIAAMHPIPKLGNAEDFSKLATFLLGKDNRWITGQIIHIDGGRSTLRKKG